MKVMHYLERIGGVSIYPIVALSIFFTIFLVFGIWAFKVNKDYIADMKNMPLGAGPETPSTSTTHQS